MNKFRELLKRGEKALRSNSPTILTALGATGVVSTAYLAHEAGVKAATFIHKEYDDATWDHWTRREWFRETWRFYIPVAISGTVTVAAILGGHRVSARRTAAVSAAYAISERAFEEYRGKVVEKLGLSKERQLRDEIAETSVRNNPPPATLVSTGGPGNILCCELLTGRYFLSDVEALKRANNEINNEINKHLNATLSDFYDLIGLRNTSMSDYYGWEQPNLMYLVFSTVMTPDERPCVAFDYNYMKEL